MVDDGVDEGVGQVIGAGGSDAALGGSQSLADGFEDVAGALLEGDDVPRTDDQAELFVDQRVALGVILDHPQDDEDEALVIVQLGPLARAQHVLHRQGMQPNVLADRLDHLDVVEAIDVDPRHAAAALIEKEGLID